jgi:hypothetical protein
MPRFKPYDHNQNAMVVINFQDQIQPGTFEYALHYLVENKLDLSVFHPDYANDETGRLAYDPAVLLKIFFSRIPRVLPPAARLPGVVRPTSCSKPSPAILFPTSPRLPVLSVRTVQRWNRCSSRCCWSVINKACWAMNFSP